MNGNIAQASPVPPRPKRVSTPTLLQMEATECGAASLGIVLAYYGRFVGLEELRLACGVSRDGASAASIVKAARLYGLKVRTFSMEPAALRSFRCPVIIFWEFNHFLIVEGFGRGQVFLNDPASGPRTVTDAEFDANFTGVVLALEPGPDFRPAGKKHTLAAALSRRLKGSHLAVTFVALASLLLVVPGMVIPAFSRILVDGVFNHGMDDWLRPLLIGMAGTALLRGFITWIQQRYLARLETRFALTESTRFLWRLLHLPASFFSQRHPGELGSRVSSNDRVAELLSQELATKVFNAAVAIFFAALLFSYDVALASVAIASAALNVMALWYVSRGRVDANRKLVKDREKAFGIAMSGLQTIDSLKATGSETEFFRRWASHQARWLNAEQQAGFYTRVLSAVPPLLSSLGNALVLVVGGLSVMDGRMSIGMLVAFQSLMGYFLDPVAELVQAGSSLQEAEGYLARLDDVMEFGKHPSAGSASADGIVLVPSRHGSKWFCPLSRTLRNDSVAPGSFETASDSADDSERLSGGLELVDVTFGYNPIALPLIQNLSLSLRPGDRVALVGATGSGKSTVARLVMGLYTPTSGQVLLDGRPRNHMIPALLNDSVAMVDQEVVLFAGTIRENLTLWDPSVSQTDLVRAASDASIHDEIIRRPGGYDAPVAEGGANFSAGERQRLEIARALARNPSLLVLDEATSALDSISESTIIRNLRLRGCTCLIVAHRLSTIRDADEILVFDGGKVVQRGTHTDMSRSGGAYASLIASDGGDTLEADPAAAPECNQRSLFALPA